MHRMIGGEMVTREVVVVAGVVAEVGAAVAVTPSSCDRLNLRN